MFSVWDFAVKPLIINTIKFICVYFPTHDYGFHLTSFPIAPEPGRPFPTWPDDFRWNNAGPLRDQRCVQIAEPSDKHTWHDNFFCSSGDKKDPGMKWSFAGQVDAMKCVQIKEPSDPNTWHDNYLCLPIDSPLSLQWSHAGPIAGKACIQWSEPSDPKTWQDNYLCGKPLLIIRFIVKGLSIVAG